MKSLKAACAALALAVTIAGCGSKSEPKQYVCPMGHATSDKPGNCPTCGMEMTEKK